MMAAQGQSRRSLLLSKKPTATVSTGSLTNENVYRWYDADYLALIDGDFIDSTTAWTNRAYAGDDLTGVTTTRPTFRTGIQNGKPGILYDGTDDITTMTAIGNHSAITVTIVAHSTFTPATATVGLMDYSGDTDEIFLDQSADPFTSIKLTDSSGNNGQSDAFPAGVLITNAMMLTVACSGSGCDYYMNGTNYGTDAIGSFSLNLDRVGTVSGNQFKGYIHEIIINTNLTATAMQVSNLWAVHISNKWFAATEIVPEIAWYKLNDGSGSTAVDDANSNDGTVANATWDTGVLVFDGTGDTVTLANESSFDRERTDGFTVTAWINMNSSATGTDVIFVKNQFSGNFPGYHFLVDTDNQLVKAFILDNAGGSLTVTSSGGSVTLNSEHFVALTYDGSSAGSGFKIYVNNGSAATGSGTIAATILNNTSAYLGYGGGLGVGDFHGRMNDVRVYNRELSSGEIATLYSGGPK